MDVDGVVVMERSDFLLRMRANGANRRRTYEIPDIRPRLPKMMDLPCSFRSIR